MNRAEKGRGAEDAAADYFLSRGCRVLEKNFRAKVGEIDLIVQDGEEAVFVEVRARASAAFGGAAASVDGRKRLKIIRAAEVWRQARHWNGACRFDVVAIDGEKFDHIPGAFDAGGR